MCLPLRQLIFQQILGSADISCLEFNQLLCHPSADWGLVLKNKSKLIRVALFTQKKLSGLGPSLRWDDTIAIVFAVNKPIQDKT